MYYRTYRNRFVGARSGEGGDAFEFSQRIGGKEFDITFTVLVLKIKFSILFIIF